MVFHGSRFCSTSQRSDIIESGELVLLNSRARDDPWSGMDISVVEYVADCEYVSILNLEVG